MFETLETKEKKFTYRHLVVALSLAVALIYYFSNPEPDYHYDYTFRVADNMSHNGKIAFQEQPPSWLNEFVPFEGNWYSVFPLGSVATMTPFTFLVPELTDPADLRKTYGIVKPMPAGFLAALSAGVICLFMLLIARHYDLSRGKQILLTTAFLFGTWMWVNETMAGAWQLALGFSMIGGLGAIYFSVFNRKAFLAGLFFALAFGNRTEFLLTAPIFMFLLFYGRVSSVESREPETELNDSSEKTAKKKKHKKKEKPAEADKDRSTDSRNLKTEILRVKEKIFGDPQLAFRTLAAFCAVPFVLGVSTLVYNYARFHSFTDFGYARIPGVLDEPWYNHGIFSWRYIPGQAWEMLWKPWETRKVFPYLVPNGFSSSILWSSPFLLFLLRFGARDKVLKYAAWLAIVPLTVLLWMHGNSGGWQFGYRYWMVCLPFAFLILLENSPKRITPVEWTVYGFSFVVNAFAVYLFHWSNYLKP